MSGAESGYLLRIENASLSYTGRLSVLEDANLELREGEVVALVGPNGGGKTSLLRLIAGLAPGFFPAEAKGMIIFRGHPLSPGDNLLRENTSLLQPDPQLQVVGLTPLHEALLAPIIKGVEETKALELARRALRIVELEGRENEPTSYLSTGLLQRAGLAGLLTSEPKLLLLDEPTSHLDPQFRRRVPTLLRKLASEQGLGVLVAGQDPLIARSADRVYCVDKSVSECSVHWEQWLDKKTKRQHVPTETLTLDTRPPHQPSGHAVISLRGVEIAYPGGRRVLEDVNLQAHPGEVVALVGPNGGGKTSLLRLIAGLLKPAKGSVEVSQSPAYLPSEPLLIFSRGTLGEELGSMEPPLKIPGELRSTPVTWLSRGQLQLAALSLLLARAPSSLLLLDEPTFALDPGWARVVRELMRALAEEGYTIVAATHDEQLAEKADRVYHVQGGRVWEA